MCAKVIPLADSSRQVLLHLVAQALHTTQDNIVPACIRLTHRLVAKVPDGYVLYRPQDAEVLRAALVVNVEVDGMHFPFIYHHDDGQSHPVGLLMAKDEYQVLGSFADHVAKDENLDLFHALDFLIPLHLNGIGVIQAIHLARQAGIRTYDRLGLQRVVKQTLQMLQT